MPNEPFTVNGLREQYGLEPIEGGDLVLVKTEFGVVPLDSYDLYVQTFSSMEDKIEEVTDA